MRAGVYLDLEAVDLRLEGHVVCVPGLLILTGARVGADLILGNQMQWALGMTIDWGKLTACVPTDEEGKEWLKADLLFYRGGKRARGDQKPIAWAAARPPVEPQQVGPEQAGDRHPPLLRAHRGVRGALVPGLATESRAGGLESRTHQFSVLMC